MEVTAIRRTMMGQRSVSLGGQTFTIRNSLLRSLILLVLAVGGGFLVMTILGARHAVRALSSSLISSTEARIETGLMAFFEPVVDDLLVARDWGSTAYFDHEKTERLNALFRPILEHGRQVSSLLIARNDGREYMLLRTPDGWTNRRTRADEWGGRTRWFRWSDSGELLSEEWRELDYDPRERPWFTGATEAGGEIAWTEPYTFFTTKEPGITASLAWKTPDDVEYVTAFDILLADISLFTTSLEVGETGMAVVLTEDGRVLGLPRHARFLDPASIRTEVLRPASELGIPDLTAAVEAWIGEDGPDERTHRFDAGGHHTWCGFRPFGVGGDTVVWMGVIVPESDLLGDILVQRKQILFITAVALILAVLMAVVIDAAVSRRVRRMQDEIRNLGQYTLETKIGEGGMGSVYRASHAMLRRPTAVKLLRADLGQKSFALERFEQEVQLTASLTHPNTIAIFDYGRTPEGIFYYAMEYLDGVDLRTLVEQTGPMEPARVIHVLRQACGSLAEAHSAGLVHRDIKPANLMLCERGGEEDVIKVLDFGLVKEKGAGLEITQEHSFLGTPLYACPEALTSPDAIDARGDLYSLGAVAYFLVTGTPPFDGHTIVDIGSKHLREEPESLAVRLGAPVPADLEAVILACLAKKPENRPASAGELSERLAACADAARWSSVVAAAWWVEHRGRLLRDEPPSAVSQDTMAVDLATREG